MSIVPQDPDGKIDPSPGCVCTDWCPEDENPCLHCRRLDIYEPCPRIGFGCGVGGNTFRCDCCTDEQWAAAGGTV